MDAQPPWERKLHAPGCPQLQKLGCFLERDGAVPAAGPGRRGREGALPSGAVHPRLFLKAFEVGGGRTQVAGGVPLWKGWVGKGSFFPSGGTWVWPFVEPTSIFTEEK